MATTINFPSVASPSFPLEPVYDDGVIRTPFENGAVQSRNKFTRRRKGYVLRWNYMTPTDHSTMETFFWTTLAGGSLSFNWTNPFTSETSEYRAEGPPKDPLVTPLYYQYEITIREV